MKDKSEAAAPVRSEEPLSGITWKGVPFASNSKATIIAERIIRRLGDNIIDLLDMRDALAEEREDPDNKLLKAELFALMLNDVLISALADIREAANEELRRTSITLGGINSSDSGRIRDHEQRSGESADRPDTAMESQPSRNSIAASSRQAASPEGEQAK